MMGLGQTLFPGALFTLATKAKAQSSPIVGGGEVKANTEAMAKITPEMIEAAAVIAGISRDGIVMAAGLLRGLDNSDAAKFGFLLATPIILAQKWAFAILKHSSART